MKAVIIINPCSITILFYFLCIFLMTFSSAAKLSINVKSDDEFKIFPNEIEEGSGNFIDEDIFTFGDDLLTLDEYKNEDGDEDEDPILVDSSSSPISNLTSTTTSFTSKTSMSNMASFTDTVVVIHQHQESWIYFYNILIVISIVVLSIR